METHYFTFGLKNAAISSRAFGKLQNKYGYQGDYAENDEETGYDEFDLRNYDAQLGRWLQPDPYDEFASGYVGMGNDPVNCVDPDGGDIESLGTLLGGLVGGTAAYIVAKNNGASFWTALGAGIGGGLIGAGLTYSAFESLDPGAYSWSNLNGSKSFFGNFGAFFSGLFGNGGEHLGPLGNVLWTPNIWGSSAMPSLASSILSPDRILPHLARAITDFGPKQAVPMAPQPTPPPFRGLNVPPPNIPHKPHTTDVDITVRKKLGSSSPLFDRSLSEEQKVFVDGIVKDLKSRCKTCLIQSVNVTVPIVGNIDNTTLSSTNWPGGTAVNKWGERVDELSNYKPPFRLRPSDGNGFSGANNLNNQGLLMGQRIIKGLGGAGSYSSTLSRSVGGKFSVQIRGKCIN